MEAKCAERCYPPFFILFRPFFLSPVKHVSLSRTQSRGNKGTLVGEGKGPAKVS